MTNAAKSGILCLPKGERRGRPGGLSRTGQGHLDKSTFDNEFLQANPQLSA